MRVRFSPDGIHWTEPIIPEGLGRVGDTHNNAWWDPDLGKYVLITRLMLGQRLVARSESDDFIHWKTPTLALKPTFGEGVARQMYCMPAFRYAGIYLGYLMMYNVAADRSVDCELAWSSDSVNWRRVAPGVQFIPRGPKGSYDSACIYAPSGPAIIRDGRIEIIYGGSATPHLGWARHCLPCMAALRVDGFAGYRQANAQAPAVVVTQPMLVSDDVLRVTADAAGGQLLVRVLDADGKELRVSEPIVADVTDAPVQWAGAAKPAPLKGRMVRLAFEFRNAVVYAFDGVRYVPPPAIEPAIRRFQGEINVALRAPRGFENAVVRYTLDGAVPSAASPVYEAPIRMSQSAPVRAALFLPDVLGHGPVGAADFVRYVPRSAAPDAPVVVHEFSFDDGLTGWRALDRAQHHRTGGEAGGYVTVSRPGGSGPFIECGPGALGGAFMGDLPKRYGGDGVEVRFSLRGGEGRATVSSRSPPTRWGNGSTRDCRRRARTGRR